MAGKGNTFKAFYVAYGGESFHLDRYIETARRSKRRVILLDGEAVTESQLIDAFESMSEDPRTFVVDNAQAVKGGKEIRSYVEAHDARDQSVVLIAIVRSEKLSELWSFVAQHGKRIEFKKIKPWQKDAYLNFITAEATRNEVAIRKDAAEGLYQCTGPDLYRLANEIKKLGVYVGQGGEIGLKLVAEMATKTPHAEPHLIAEAVMAKDMRRALSLFSVLCLKSGEAQYSAVVFALMKQVESAVVIRSLQDKGIEAADIASQLDVNIWRFNEAMAPVARKHDLKSLVGYMRALSKLDADVKSSSPFKRTMIEMAMLQISN